MNKPDYLPIHDHFYGFTASQDKTDEDHLVRLLAEKLQVLNIQDRYPSPEYDSQELPNGWTLGYFVTPTTTAKTISGAWEIKEIEFEKPDTNGWWDIYARLNPPKFKLSQNWDATGRGRLKHTDLEKWSEPFHYDDSAETIKEAAAEVTISSINSNGTIANSIPAIRKLLQSSGRTETIVGDSDHELYIEYKTSIEELNIEATIRQVKNRGQHSDHHTTVVLATFDPRFEQYRSTIENEGIRLCIFDDVYRQTIQDRFDDSSKTSLNPYIGSQGE